jgi:hypothetical protein
MGRGEPCTWRYKTWGGSICSVVGSTVEFTPAHVVWRDQEGAVVLAETVANVHQLTEVGHLGSATRHLAS